MFLSHVKRNCFPENDFNILIELFKVYLHIGFLLLIIFRLRSLLVDDAVVIIISLLYFLFLLVRYLNLEFFELTYACCVKF